MKIIVFCLALFLVGCATSPETQRVQLSKTLFALTKQADSLERAGVISNEVENMVIDKLIYINEINQGFKVCEGGGTACIDQLLNEAIAILEAAQ